MATNPNPRAALQFVLEVERLFSALASLALSNSGSDREPSLGGKLLYAGSLDAQARALLVAANIAGAASLAVSADANACKQAIRDGVADFLVTSLDEALRILKNEIRKRETAAVCVALAPEYPEAEFARQLLQRGVLPDLLAPRSASAEELASFLSQGALRVETLDSDAKQVLLAWSVDSAPAQWLPKLDALALDCLPRNCLGPEANPAPPSAWAARRWLRLAPRYLGRMALGQRLLRCDESSAEKFLGRVRQQVENAEIGVSVNLTLSRNGQTEWSSFSPPAH